MAEVLAKLEAEYCPPIDPALLSAILSDFDLSIERNVLEARNTLDPLKESALLEEAAGFDASGTGAQDEGLVGNDRAESCPESSAVLSRGTDLTSISNGIASLNLSEEDDSRPTADVENLDQLDEEAKVQLLMEVFKDRVSRNNAQYTLRKCNGRWQAAMEELLNHVYFSEASQSDSRLRFDTKSVDAFSEDNMPKRGRKGKSKGKHLRSLQERRSSSLPVSPVNAPEPPTNKWQTAAEDIEFVASRVDMPIATIRSIYYANETSLARTIGSVLKESIKNDAHSDDPILAVNTYDLSADFPSIAPEYVAALVRLTHPSTAAGRELAAAMTTQPRATNGGIQIVPTYARPDLNEAELSEHEGATRPNNGPLARAVHRDSESMDASGLATAYSAARSAAFSQARAAHRKARSDRLMGGAAAYYGQVGREYAALSARASSAAADELAAAQSTPSQLDLHGIDVLNAVRIAQDKVEQWWEGLGEHRANGRVGAEERKAGYRIVVGLGKHSEGGKGKLGPAVSKALREGGWKIESMGASIMVKGKARS